MNEKTSEHIDGYGTEMQSDDDNVEFIIENGKALLEKNIDDI